MNTPNWMHNSGKDAKRKLKPQAMRQARKARNMFLTRLERESKRTHLKGSPTDQSDKCHNPPSQGDFSLV